MAQEPEGNAGERGQGIGTWIGIRNGTRIWIRNGSHIGTSIGTWMGTGSGTWIGIRNGTRRETWIEAAIEAWTRTSIALHRQAASPSAFKVRCTAGRAIMRW